MDHLTGEIKEEEKKTTINKVEWGRIRTANRELNEHHTTHKRRWRRRTYTQFSVVDDDFSVAKL